MSEARTLKIGRGVELPAELITQTVAILGKKRSGKSHTAARGFFELRRRRSAARPLFAQGRGAPGVEDDDLDQVLADLVRRREA